MRRFLLFGGTLALIGATVLAFLPVTGEVGVTIGPITVGSPFDTSVECGSVADPVQARDGTGLVGQAAEFAAGAVTTCDELLEERAQLVLLAGGGGAVAILLGLALNFFLLAGRGLGKLFRSDA